MKTNRHFTLIELLVVVGIHLDAGSQLLVTTDAVDVLGAVAGLVQGRQQHSRKDRDHRYHDRGLLPYIAGNGSGSEQLFANSKGSIPKSVAPYVAKKFMISGNEEVDKLWECPRLPYTATWGTKFYCGRWLNGYLFYTKDAKSSRMLSQTKDPSSKIMMFDSLATVKGNINDKLYFRPQNASTSSSFKADRKGAHGTSNGTLFVDGHAGGISQSHWMNSGNSGINNTAFNAHEPYQQGATGTVAQ